VRSVTVCQSGRVGGDGEVWGQAVVEREVEVPGCEAMCLFWR